MTSEPKYPAKSEWGDGPWQEEQDELNWRDFMSGYDCLILRHQYHGQLNGYVKVPVKNKLYRAHYDAIHRRLPGLSVHGGLTFAGKLAGRRGYWVGFDTAHHLDLAPGLIALTDKVNAELNLPRSSVWRGGVYRNMAYVWQETTSLAMQLTRMER